MERVFVFRALGCYTIGDALQGLAAGACDVVGQLAVGVVRTHFAGQFEQGLLEEFRGFPLERGDLVGSTCAGRV